ncbi:MAG TPA: hypothetical protein VFH95_06590 [Candidatus Kapabacteria bacterium]|nr:hypothetical protein [Candidatus Kapabacteria bacterium]
MPYPSFEEFGEWIYFRQKVKGDYPHFFIELSKAHPGLTNHEVMLCSLFLLGCPTPEIAERMGGKTIDAILTAKYRLSKKFKLKRGEKLRDHLLQIAAGNYAPPHLNP